MDKTSLENRVAHHIHLIRERRVILDEDLARLYGVETKALNQAVKRNQERFPEDFVFRLTSTEIARMRSQFVTGCRRNVRYSPYAYSEHGALMAANVLNSRKAIQMSVFVVRAFVRMRHIFGVHQELALKLTELEKTLTARLDTHETAITDVLRQVLKLLNPPEFPEPEGRPIGFRTET